MKFINVDLEAIADMHSEKDMNSADIELQVVKEIKKVANTIYPDTITFRRLQNEKSSGGVGTESVTDILPTE